MLNTLNLVPFYTVPRKAGRDYRLNRDDLLKLENIEGVTELVSGGAPGVDTDAERWADQHEIPIKKFKPDWKQYGRGAGPII
jgi:hypothetical protein